MLKSTIKSKPNNRRNSMTEESTNPAEAAQPEFSQGICGDGAAILMDGQQLTVEEILNRLRGGVDDKQVKSRVISILKEWRNTPMLEAGTFQSFLLKRLS
jgi:hypothetical protein